MHEHTLNLTVLQHGLYTDDNLPKSQTNRLQVIQNFLARAVVKAPKSVTSLLFSNLYIGLKSMNALNINFFLLPIKLLPLLNLLMHSLISVQPLVLLDPHLSSPFLDHLHLLL